MQGPDGTQMPNRGVYLEVVPNERLVFTDAYTSAWVPSAKPFFTCILTFEDEDGQTRYTARARHWSAEDCAAHETDGIPPGLGRRHRPARRAGGNALNSHRLAPFVQETPP